MYADLLRAQLDPRRQAVHVSSVSPLRDLAPDSVPDILGQLRDWSGRCSTTLADLEAQVASIRDAAARRHAEKSAREATHARLVDEAGKNPAGELGGQGGVGGGAGGGSMVHGRRQAGILNQALAGIRAGRYGSGGGGGGYYDPAGGGEMMELDDDEFDDAGGDIGGGGGGAGGGNRGGKRTSTRRKL